MDPFDTQRRTMNTGAWWRNEAHLGESFSFYHDFCMIKRLDHRAAGLATHTDIDSIHTLAASRRLVQETEHLELAIDMWINGSSSIYRRRCTDTTGQQC